MPRSTRRRMPQREIALRRRIAGLEHDLAAQRAQADENLSLLNEFVATAPVGRALVDADLRFVLINEYLAEINGLPVAAHIGRTVGEVLPELKDILEPIYRRVLAGEPVTGVEIAGTTPREPGRTRHFLTSYLPLRSRKGINVVVQEITERKEAEDALGASEERFRAIAEHASEFIFRYRLGPPLSVEYVSPSAVAFTGYTPEDYMADPELGFRQVHPDDRASLAAFRADPARFQPRHELRWVRKDGRVIWVEQSVRLLHDDAGRPAVFQGVVRDITERKEVEDALRASEERFRAIVETSQNLILLTDPAGTLLYASPSSARLLGYAPEELVGRRLGTMVVPEDLAAVVAQHGTIAESFGSVATFTARLRHNDGSWRWFRVTRNNQLENPALGAVIGSLQDITEQKLAEEAVAEALRAEREAVAELEASEARLRAIGERLVAVQEEERLHLARELHDEIGQSLTALSLLLAIAPTLPPATAADRMADARRQVGAIIGQVRRRSLDLRPALLDDLGLLAALEMYISRYQEQTGIAVAFAAGDLGAEPAPQIGLTAYRIVQEGLTNVARHAGVAAARVRIWAADARLLVLIEDQGAGMDVEAVLAACASSGLLGMRERAALLGGELSIDSEPGRGTRLLCDLPIGPAPAPETPP